VEQGGEVAGMAMEFDPRNEDFVFVVGAWHGAGQRVYSPVENQSASAGRADFQSSL
jgi:hypothetical protein